jgi:hypothetical protein
MFFVYISVIVGGGGEGGKSKFEPYLSLLVD